MPDQGSTADAGFDLDEVDRAEGAVHDGTAIAEQLALLDDYRAHLRRLDRASNMKVATARVAANANDPFGLGFIRHYRPAHGIRPVRSRAACPVARTTPRPRGAGRPRAQATRSSTRSGDSGDDGPEPEPPRRKLAGPSPRFSRLWRPHTERRIADLLDGQARPRRERGL